MAHVLFGFTSSNLFLISEAGWPFLHGLWEDCSVALEGQCIFAFFFYFGKKKGTGLIWKARGRRRNT
ncbi:MAG: hypothetical protein AAF388_02420, partial [Bacteroidota bacterium]